MLAQASRSDLQHVNWRKIAPILIFALAFILRFWALSDTKFNIDQIYPVWQGLSTLQSGTFPLAGQGTSVLFANPTLTGYFFAPFLILGPTPYVPFVVTILLNTIAVWLAYRALYRIMGFEIAIMAMLLMAVNPWVIEYSRQTWVQSLMPFFVTLIFWALTYVILAQTHRPKRWLLITLIACALFANTYLLAYFIVVPVGILLLIFWKTIPQRALIIGSAIFGVLLLIYLVGLVDQWEHTRARADDFLQGNSSFSDESLNHALRLVTGQQYPVARGFNASANDAERRHDITTVLHYLWVAAMLGGIVFAINKWRTKGINRSISTILLIWFSLPIVAMAYTSRQVHPFYLLFTLPAGHALAAWGVSPLLKWRSGQWIIGIVLVATVGVNSLNSMRYAQETAENPGAEIPYTLPVDVATNLGQDLRRVYQDDMIVYTSMDVWSPMVLSGEILPVIRNATVQEMMVIPPQGGLYMTFYAPDQMLEPPIHGRLAEKPMYLADGTRAVIWEAYQDFMPPHVLDAGSDIGVRFYGWHLLEPLQAGQTSTLRTYWRVDGLPLERFGWSFVPFVHVYDDTTARIAIVDGVYVPMQTWQVGDWMVQSQEITIPVDSVGPYRLAVGLFDGVRMVNAIFSYPQNDETVFTATLTILE